MIGDRVSLSVIVEFTANHATGSQGHSRAHSPSDRPDNRRNTGDRPLPATTLRRLRVLPDGLPNLSSYRSQLSFREMGKRQVILYTNITRKTRGCL